MIPPPIVQSAYADTSSRTTTNSIIVEKPSALQDRQRELEADLQFLLDAQAEGLVRGLEGGKPDDRSSTGSTTPTVESVRSSSARKPTRKRPGLRSARKGIYSRIQALSALKLEELQAIGAEANEKAETLSQIDEWERKRAGLQKATRHMDDGDAIRAQRLRQEADSLQEEISTMEIQLDEMKARQRKILRKAAEVENSVQAKLASYTSSLSMLEQDVQKFLSREPSHGHSEVKTSSSTMSLWQIPAKQRTLEMARKQYSAEREQILDQLRSVDYEKEALDEGAEVWKEVVVQVTDFEKQLKSGVAELSFLSSSHSAWEDPPSPQLSKRCNAQRLGELIQHLDAVLGMVESKFKLAEEKDWKLLIAAIGAELDALKKGKQILQSLLPINGLGEQDDLLRIGERSPQNGTSDAFTALESHDKESDRVLNELETSLEMARPVSNAFKVGSENGKLNGSGRLSGSAKIVGSGKMTAQTMEESGDEEELLFTRNIDAE